jgi:hypothetical protein
VAPKLATNRAQALGTQLVGRGCGFGALDARLGALGRCIQVRVEVGGQGVDVEAVFGDVFVVVQSILLRA